MNCKEFKNISLLFIDNDLAEEIKSSAKEHLSNCESCSSYITKMNSLYSETNNLLINKKTDVYFYTRLKVKMESELSVYGNTIPQISHYLKPAFFTLIIFTIILSFLLVTGNLKTNKQVISAISIQINMSDDQDYMKTVAMNEQTFEEDYIKIIDK